MRLSSSHGPWSSPNNLAEVIDTAGELGVELVSSGFGPEDFADMATIRAAGAKVNAMDERLRAAGLTLFFHNHWWEFDLVDGRLKFDVFAELAPMVSFEIDTYWATNFGAVDPAVVVKRYAKRVPLLHVKDGPLVKGQPMVAVGSGKMDFRTVIGATDMLQAVRRSYDWLVGRGLASGRRKPGR